MEEINEIIEDVGQANITDLSQKFGLPTDFLRDMIGSKLETSFPRGCQLNPMSLTTKSYDDRLVARVRGQLRGCTRPSTLSSLAQTQKIEDFAFKNITEILIANG